MVDISKILGGPWTPPSVNRDTPEIQLLDAIRAAGLTPPGEVVLDGKIHRFASGAKGSGGSGDKAGWYLAFGDGLPAGRFGCWRSGVEVTWRADVGRKYTPAEEMAHVRRMAEAKVLRDAELTRKHEVAATTVETIWSAAQAASADHPYLVRKSIETHGARVTGDGRLVVPLYSGDGTLSTLQYIDHAGGKLYHAGGQTTGKYWMLGSMDEPGLLYVAEGFATAATIHQATNRPVVAAYSASNLVPVTAALREAYPSQAIVIVADNDKSGVGQRYAEQAAAKYGARIVMPAMEGDANDYVQAGHDLMSLLNPPAHNWLIPADEFSAQPAPISWLIKRWLQAQALVMVHGPSGGGKTFVVLDWCLRIASGTEDWAGHKVRPTSVVYLAGEGHHGLRGRVAAWKHHHGVSRLQMWLSKDGCDLNTPTGYSLAVDQIRLLNLKPGVVVVDTLHRFLAGDENSAQDAKTMLDACSALMAEFSCSVILVHHTGVSDEAQHRARGSSAWRGALDIEISIVAGKDGGPITIVQRKSKDAEIAEPIFVTLEQVAIPGWLDEDGQSVTSAVVTPSAAPVAVRKDSKVEAHRKTFENAWWASRAEERDGKPFVSRTAMINYLVTKMGVSEASAKIYIKPSAIGKPIADLLIAEIIEATDDGWIVTHPSHASSMMVRKGAR